MTYPDTYNGLHSHLDERVRRTAQITAPYLVELLKPKSVIDVGCGSGIWLSAFNGLERLGLDGDYIDRATLRIPQDQFRGTDLNQPFTVERQYDLAICLEVAEHIPPESAETFIDSLTATSPAIFFSAAIPGQGGMGHVNEQWPSYWRAKFEARGYVAFDTVRRWLWPRNDVLYWYAQNSLLYVSAATLDRYPALQQEPRDFISDMIHPERYRTLDRTARAGESPSVGFLVKSIPGAVSRFAKARLGIPLKLREPSQ